MNLKTSLSLTFSLLLIGFLIVDGFIKEEAMEENEHLVKALRENRSNFLDTFMVVFSAIAYPETVLICLFLFYFFSRDKMNSLAYVVYAGFASYLNSVLKIAYGQGRPYFLYPSISLIFKCETGYGHPSGHAMVGIVYMVLLADWLLHELDYGKKRLIDIDCSIIAQVEKEPKFKTWHYFLYAFVVGVAFTIGLSRVYLGVHSYEQVLSGWAYGGLYLIFHYNFGKEFFINLFKEMGENKDFLGFKGMWAVFLLNVVQVLFIAIPIMVFLLSEEETKRNNFIALLKGNCSSIAYYVLDRKALLDSGLMATLFGLLNGAYYSKGEIDEYHIYSKEKTPLTFFKKIFRLIFIALFFAITVGILKVFQLVEVVYVTFILGSWFNFFFFGFSNSFILPLIFQRLKLNYGGDYMKVINYEIN